MTLARNLRRSISAADPPRSPFVLRRAVPVLLVIAGAALMSLLVLAQRPAIALENSYGLYAPEGSPRAYRWSTNKVSFSVHDGSDPSAADLTIAAPRWSERAEQRITLGTEQTSLATLAVAETMRRYHLLVPQGTSTLLLETGVDRPAQGDRRWLGVQLYEATGTVRGLPLHAIRQATTIAGIVAMCVVAIAAGARRGYGVVVALTVLALLARSLRLQIAPPGWSQDEVVSLVDAWHLSRTARDHLGNAPPLGAQEALGDYISPMLTYLELPLALIWGPQPWVGRLVTAIIGALAVPLGFMIARRLKLPQIAAASVGLVIALSPWQVFLTRFALPPALVPTTWLLAVWAALRFVQHGQQRDAMWLAVVAGMTVYAYPTMKMAVPLLVAAATLLALRRFGFRAARNWLVPALIVIALWLPFAATNLLIPASNTRLRQTALRADGPVEFAQVWWANYRAYFSPDLFYATGDNDPIHNVPDHGLQLAAEAPLLLIGLGALFWYCLAPLVTSSGAATKQTQALGLIASSQRAAARKPLPYQWWLLGAALLIAPLPASFTNINPHAWRAALLAPMYALCVGLGVAVVINAMQRIASRGSRFFVQSGCALVFAAILMWQFSQWFVPYLTTYPPSVAWVNQDGLREALARAVRYAPQYDEVLISNEGITEPYIYVLAAQPMPPSEAQAAIEVTRRPPRLNDVTAIGKYRFGSVAAIPDDAPVVEAVADRFGGPAFVLQAWRTENRAVLVVRRME